MLHSPLVTQREWQHYFRKNFSAARVLTDIAAVWREARWNSAERLAVIMRDVARNMKRAGLTDIEIVNFPSDGRKHYGGWKMPLAWSPRAATLETLSPKLSLADYRVTPNNLMLYSAATPARGIEADLVFCTFPLTRSALARVRGKIAFVDKLPNGLDATRALRRAGALGVVTDNIQPVKGIKEGAYLDDAVAFYNYSWPPWEVPARERGFGFCLSPRVGRQLRELLARGPVRVRARVQLSPRRFPLPLITARVRGTSGRDIILTGHIDEQGANDNASGPMIALEIARVLAKTKTHHGLRLLFSAEARGLQALVNERRDLIRGGLLALNLDMLGCDQRVAHSQLNVIENFPALPDPQTPILLRALKRLPLRWRLRDYELNDNILGEPLIGIPTLQLHQAPDATYHTSLDTPATLSPNAIARLGTVLGAHVAYLANADAQEIRRMAETIAESDLPKKHQRLDELLRLLPSSNVSPFVSEAHRAKLRRDGLSEEAATRAHVERLKRKIGAEARNSVPYETSRIVPLKLFRGYLGGEDLSARERAKLKRDCDLDFGWGASHWLQWALFWSNGKRSLGEISELCDVPTERLAKAFRWLRRKGYVRFRPYLTERDLQRALRRVCVRRGSVLMVHSSLSQFGYIEGGAATVVRALEKFIGARGTLVMPTHSLSWLGEKPYAPKRSPSVVGAVSEFFRKQRGVVRSNHPTHSVAARGALARALVRGHDHRVAPQAREGFWGNFVAADGWVLMMSPLGSNTLIHAGELWGGVPMPDIVVPLRNGRRAVVPSAPWHTNYFERVYRVLRRKRQIRSTRLGESRIFLLRSRDVIEATLKLVRRDPLAVTVRGCACAFCRHVRRKVRDRERLSAR